MGVEVLEERVPSWETFPFSLPAVRALDGLRFTTPVTFFVGENGVGKSTLLEAIAIAFGFNAEGGSRNFNFASHETHSPLHEAVRLVKRPKGPSDGFFLRAESFYNVATEVERLGAVRGYGDRSLHELSHGESFISLTMNRFWGDGFYIMDEPEAALSPTRQLAFLVRLKDLVARGSQFIIATHSPLIMAFPGATIYEISDGGLREVRYTETDHYLVTKRFVNDPERMLERLFRDE
ncbi:MAG TPA: AAA family ATPase [Thermoanaerobaculia bacterium]|nr:AAA family ATPase [Thermoanaerobaculia bacterium]